MIPNSSQTALYSLVFLFCLPLLLGFVEINIGTGNQVNTGTVSSGDCLDGNNKTASENRRIDSLSSIEVAGSAFDLTIQEGNETSLSVTADENLLPHIVTEVTGERLIIRADRSLCTQNPMTIHIVSPGLQAVTATGANTIVMKGEYENLTVSLNGASDLTLSGGAQKLTAELQGSTTLNAAGCKALKVEVRAFGSSTAKVHAEKALRAESHGASDIVYSGNPAELNVQTSGAGDISSLK